MYNVTFRRFRDPKVSSMQCAGAILSFVSPLYNIIPFCFTNGKIF